MHVDLKELLMDYCNANPSAVVEETVSDCVLSITQLRDRLYLLGNILYEDIDSEVYVTSVRAGIAKLSNATVALQLHGNNLRMVAFAKEGLIKQRICEKAIQLVSDAARGKPVASSSKHLRVLPIVVALIGIASFVAIRGAVLNSKLSDETIDSLYSPTIGVSQPEAPEVTEDPAFVAEVKQTMEATREYNSAVEQYNLLVSEYNEAVTLICIDNINGMPPVLEPLAKENESYEANAEVVEGGSNDKEKIVADAAFIRDMTSQVEMLVKIARQIKAPDGDWISSRISAIAGITGCQQVTKELDPDGLLGKDGGYVACVYFAHSAINQNEIPGNSIVEKGTDAGGALEVYANREDAEARVDYLAGFDNTILYSGSYAIVGTMVIRTSYKLTDEQQLILTDAITRAVTMVEPTTE